MAITSHSSISSDAGAAAGRRPEADHPGTGTLRAVNGHSLDEGFFTERAGQRPQGRHRGLARARALAEHLGLLPETSTEPRRISVVGSKGKGTTAVFASALLAAHGLRTGTLTSPGLRSNRERIRVDGCAIDDDAYGAVVQRVLRAIDEAGSSLPDDGYLSPTGLFTLAGMRHFADAGCDVVVAEAGLGGAGDELSLFDADVVAVTAVFAEHLGILGDSVAEIAREKLGIISARTAAVTAVAQSPEVAGILQERRPDAHIVEELPAVAWRWPAGLSGLNAANGVAAASALLQLRGVDTDVDAAAPVLDSVSLPARLSVHLRGAQRFLLDAAVDGRAAAAALHHCRSVIGAPSAVLVCLPDGKDRDGVLEALRDETVIPVRVASPHLSFTGWSAPLSLLDDIDTETLGPTMLALGTITFMRAMLDRLDVDTETVFRV